MIKAVLNELSINIQFNIIQGRILLINQEPNPDKKQLLLKNMESHIIELLNRIKQELFKANLKKAYSDEMVQNIFNQLKLPEGVLKDINLKAEELADKMINEEQK